MKYTGPIFRPPLEADTVLLQVTVGCSHNKCSFCTMYKETRFEIENIKQIEKDLQEIKQTYRTLTRIYLLNADPFALSGRRLKEIAGKIIEYFPEMETISMYASIRSIKHKSDKELLELQALRINDLWVGVESGNDETLKYLNKGFTLDTARKQLKRLSKAAIRHNGIYILGTGGKGKGLERATDSARLINDTRPQLVGVTSLGFFEGSPLTEEMKNCNFIPATELEILEEEKKLIELIEVDPIPFYGDHPINSVTIAGLLPQERDDMIDTINYVIETADKTFLNSSVIRSSL